MLHLVGQLLLQACGIYLLSKKNFLPDQRLYNVKDICICIQISNCVDILFELSLLPNRTASEAFFHKSGAVRSVD